MNRETELLREYEPLVWKIVHRRGRMYPQISRHDLFQEGCIGLLEAIRRYDPTRGSSLAWYAEIWINKAVTRFIELNASVVKLDNSHRALFYRIRSPEAPTYEDLAKEFALTVDEVRLFAAFSRSGDIPNEGSPDEEEEFIPWCDYTIDPNQALEEFEEGQLRSWVRKRALEYVATLEGREKEHFLKLLADATFSEVGQALRVSTGRVFQLEERLLEKWRDFVGPAERGGG